MSESTAVGWDDMSSWRSIVAECWGEGRVGKEGRRGRCMQERAMGLGGARVRRHFRADASLLKIHVLHSPQVKCRVILIGKCASFVVEGEKGGGI